jgi:DNA-directed RNA polymerase sigma subunit (sigma70/sigma32)
VVRTDLVNALNSVDPEPAKIIVLRYGLDGNGQRTGEQVGRMFGISRDAVRRIEQKVLPQIREELAV